MQNNSPTIFNLLLKNTSVSLLIPITIACTAFSIFHSNMGEVSGTPEQVISMLGIFIVTASLALFCPNLPFMFFRNKTWFTSINISLLSVGILLWIQSNVFAWKLGVLDGSEIEWSRFRFNMLFEVFCYIAVIVCIIRCRKWFSNYTIRLASIIIATQIITTFFTSYSVIECAILCRTSGKDQISWKNSEWTFNGLFDYSDDTDVHLLILDEFGASIFEKLLEDGPLTSETFHDFTYFDNCLCDATATAHCIPQIITGCELSEYAINPSQSIKSKREREVLGLEKIPNDPYSEFLNESYRRPFTLFDTLSRNGYMCSICTCDPTTIAWNPNQISNIRKSKVFTDQSFLQNLIEVSQLVELTLFRTVPTFFKSYCCDNFGTIRNKLSTYNPDANNTIFNQTNKMYEDEEVYEKIMTMSRNFTDKKQFKYFHLRGSHTPFRLNENIKYEKSTRIDSALRQSVAVVKIVRDYLAKLKETNSYDNSLIVVMSDHGFRTFPETSFDKTNAFRSLLLVKRPSQSRDVLQVNSSPLHIKDTTPAILTELGLERPEDSFSWFDVPQKVVKSRKNRDLHHGESDLQNQKFANETLKIGDPIEISHKYVTLQSNEVKVEILGDEYDEIGKLDNAKITLGLSPKYTQTIQYTTPLQTEYTVSKAGRRQPLVDFVDAIKSTFNKTKCWAAKAKLDLSDIPDGEYELFAVLPNNNKHIKLGKTIKVVNGIAASVNKPTTENIATIDGRIIR